jgi:hypothetical protein
MILGATGADAGRMLDALGPLYGGEVISVGRKGCVVVLR